MKRLLLRPHPMHKSKGGGGGNQKGEAGKPSLSKEELQAEALKAIQAQKHSSPSKKLGGVIFPKNHASGSSTEKFSYYFKCRSMRLGATDTQIIEYSWVDFLVLSEKFGLVPNLEQLKVLGAKALEPYLPRIKRVKKNILARRSDRPTQVWDVYGEEPDVGMYLSGEPENMAVFVDANSRNRGRRVHIDVNVTSGAGSLVSSAFLASMALEMSGYRTAVSITDNAVVYTSKPSNLMVEKLLPGHTGKFHYCQRIMAKTWASKFNLDVAQYMSAPGLLDFMFDIQRRDKRLWNSYMTGTGANFGSCAETPTALRADININPYRSLKECLEAWLSEDVLNVLLEAQQ